MKKNLKFSLELDEQGNLKAEICGDPIEVGNKLFYNLFANWEVKTYAVGIDTALRLAYPEAYKKTLKTKTKE